MAAEMSLALAALILSPSLAPSTLQHFTLFPKLPIELRLKIWRTTFRRRNIDMNLRWETRATGDTDLPIALFINKESRSETFKHYTFISPPGSWVWPTHNTDPFIAIQGQPVLLNPALDHCFVNLCSMRGLLGTIGDFGSFDVWLSDVDKQVPGGLAAIQDLEIRDVHWSNTLKSEFEGELGNCIFRFAGLKRLRLTGCRDRDGTRRMTKHGRQSCEDFLKDYLQRNKEKFVDAWWPKLIVRRKVKNQGIPINTMIEELNGNFFESVSFASFGSFASFTGFPSFANLTSFGLW